MTSPAEKKCPKSGKEGGRRECEAKEEAKKKRKETRRRREDFRPGFSQPWVVFLRSGFRHLRADDPETGLKGRGRMATAPAAPATVAQHSRQWRLAGMSPMLKNAEEGETGEDDSICMFYRARGLGPRQFIFGMLTRGFRLGHGTEERRKWYRKGISWSDERSCAVLHRKKPNVF